MRRALETFFHFGPLVFAVGFLWPLLAQILVRVGVEAAYLWAAPIALALGVIAQVRGQWL